MPETSGAVTLTHPYLSSRSCPISMNTMGMWCEGNGVVNSFNGCASCYLRVHILPFEPEHHAGP